jgi:hypothetical protein
MQWKFAWMRDVIANKVSANRLPNRKYCCEKMRRAVYLEQTYNWLAAKYSAKDTLYSVVGARVNYYVMTYTRCCSFTS